MWGRHLQLLYPHLHLIFIVGHFAEGAVIRYFLRNARVRRPKGFSSTHLEPWAYPLDLKSALSGGSSVPFSLTADMDDRACPATCVRERASFGAFCSDGMNRLRTFFFAASWLRLRSLLCSLAEDGESACVRVSDSTKPRQRLLKNPQLSLLLLQARFLYLPL